VNFGFSEEQDLLRSEARKLLDEQCPMKEVRRLGESPDAHSPALWKQLAELGWLGLTLPEEYGGAELQWIDLAVLLEEAGRGLLPSPLISSTLAATALLQSGSEEQKRAKLPGLGDGSLIGTVALAEESGVFGAVGIELLGERSGDGWVLNGVKCFVTDPGVADFFVVAFRSGPGPEDLALAVVEADAPGISAQSFAMLDTTKRLGNLSLEDVRVSADAILGKAGGACRDLGRLFDCGAVAVTAEILGAAEAALDMTVSYAKERIQFGSPIGRFQAVKHPLAEMFVQVESAKSLLYYAAWAIDAQPDDVPRAVSRAKAYASDAFVRIGIDGVQLHGTLAYTDEYDMQLYLKRSKWAPPMFGDSDYHYDRLLRLRGL
jgi:alkylation response protein AidB-like acyl-CoA dehydrogenase